MSSKSRNNRMMRINTFFVPSAFGYRLEMLKVWKDIDSRAVAKSCLLELIGTDLH